ncbi:MAG TPA: GNAT family N-acetyltransferase [Steroidobacteraceae bacterium]|jgi:phosphinothricin acetyltransferase|nr:GNAT family N-acetyltransferase [Steroidobacteraceae bacterium]
MTAGGPVITAAGRADLPEILAIYNEVIRNSTAVYSEEELSPARGETWLETRAQQGFPMIVLRDSGGIAGFGTFGDFRAWPCYRRTVEHSVHVRVDRRGQGVGRRLVVELMARAAAMDKHVMIAGIDADNAVSIGLHRSLGFAEVGRFHEVGFKFGRWLDLTFMQCILPPTVRASAQ